MNFKRTTLSLFALALLGTVALAQTSTSTLQPTTPRPAPQVVTGKDKKKSSKKSGKQAVTGEATQPAAGATGTTAAATPDADAVTMETGKGKGKKSKGGGKKAVNNDGTSAVTAIRAVLNAQVADWNAGRLEDFMQGYWNSPELTFVSSGRKLMGYDATLDRYRRTYQSDGKEMGRLTFGDLEIMPLGTDTAFVRGQYQLVMSDARELGGRFTLVVRQFAEGWKIVHDHTSANQ